MNFKRVILKLSGESLANSKNFGVNKLHRIISPATPEKVWGRIYEF